MEDTITTVTSREAKTQQALMPSVPTPRKGQHHGQWWPGRSLICGTCRQGQGVITEMMGGSVDWLNVWNARRSNRECCKPGTGEKGRPVRRSTYWHYRLCDSEGALFAKPSPRELQWRGKSEMRSSFNSHLHVGATATSLIITDTQKALSSDRRQRNKTIHRSLLQIGLFPRLSRTGPSKAGWTSLLPSGLLIHQEERREKIAAEDLKCLLLLPTSILVLFAFSREPEFLQLLPKEVSFW